MVVSLATMPIIVIGLYNPLHVLFRLSYDCRKVVVFPVICDLL